MIGVGASLNRYTIEHGYLYPERQVRAARIKPHSMMGDGQFADLYIHTDARIGVEELEKLLAARSYKRPATAPRTSRRSSPTTTRIVQSFRSIPARSIRASR